MDEIIFIILAIIIIASLVVFTVVSELKVTKKYKKISRILNPKGYIYEKDTKSIYRKLSISRVIERILIIFISVSSFIIIFHPPVDRIGLTYHEVFGIGVAMFTVAVVLRVILDDFIGRFLFRTMTERTSG